MALQPKTPGVYVEEVSKLPPSVAPVATAIPAFIGYTQKAKEYKDDDLLKKATRITSIRQYELLFGGPEMQGITVDLAEVDQPDNTKKILPQVAILASPSKFKMYHAVQLYFANGGGPCYIIPVKKTDASISDADYTTGMDVAKAVDEITLYVFPDLADLAEAKYYEVCKKAMDDCAALQDRFTIIDTKQNGTAAPTLAAPHKPVTQLRSATLGDNGKYGAAYYPWVKTTLSPVFGTDYKEANVTFSMNGNATFDAKTWDTTQNEAAVTNEFVAKLKEVIGKLRLEMPPSPIVAGVYAAVDRTRGVWKAPANVSMGSVVEPTIPVSHEDQMDLNVHSTGKSVNAIRHFTGRGTLVWGARTLAGNDNEWKYVSVRRFFNFVEESVKNSTEPFVFEPNDANTWIKVRAMIENFLTLQWRAGALQGATPEDAFFVRVGLGQTMTAVDILEGRMIVEIGMAVVRPAEFIILQFSHLMAQS